MFEYKDEAFYNEYFKSQHDFKLLSDFVQIKTKDNEIYYIGNVECVGTIHPITIRVEIPHNFPHGNLQMWTYSISGYPHLITENVFRTPHFHEPLSEEDKAEKRQKWSWFCLNTPFAETAEGQLDQELLRFRQWIEKQMREDLPPHITDAEFKMALAKANAYDWENPDEMGEFQRDRKLVFVDDYYEYDKNFEKRDRRTGVFNCVKNPSNMLYVFKDNADCNFKLPYIIVDEYPSQFKEFFALQQQYNWDANTCKHLLPFSYIDKSPTISSSCIIKCVKTYSEEDALKLLERETKKLNILPRHHSLINEQIENIREDIRKKNGYSLPPLRGPWDSPDEPERENFSSDEEYEKAYNAWMDYMADWASEEHMIELAGKIPYYWKSFALGVKCEDKIDWILFSTREKLVEFQMTTYDLHFHDVTVKDVVSIKMVPDLAIVATDKQYFGRAAINNNICEKKIAIVGLGAIGSQVAESLARSGVREIGLWDGDLVEPGNLCRSIYEKHNLGESKMVAMATRIKSISPFCKVNYSLNNEGWHPDDREMYYTNTCHGGDLYGNVNYNSQEDIMKALANYDIIIDCTGSNELLHFLSYAIQDKVLISLCITNKAKNLLCMTNSDGNPFEFRKMYLSKIEQDTKNYYHEGSGCYSPTFFASYSDISSLVSLAVRKIISEITERDSVSSTIWSYDDRGVIADNLLVYTCNIDKNNSIELIISSETLADAEDMEYSSQGPIGFLFGGFTADRKQILVSHCVCAIDAEQKLDRVFHMSGGIIDYLGDYEYSCEDGFERYNAIIELLSCKSSDESINTNNPILAMRDTEGAISFYLYCDGCLYPFVRK